MDRCQVVGSGVVITVTAQRRGRPLRIAPVAMALMAATFLACSSLPPPAPAGGVPVAPPAATSQTAEAGAGAWQIPAADLGSQRLFRLRYDGPEGEVGLRLTLWLAAPDRYRLSAADLFGRAVWSLSVEVDEGLWLDHRNSAYCRFAGTIELAAVPLSPFRFTALPALLLGRLPEPPAEWLEPAGEYLDDEGKRWTYQASNGRLLKWTVWQRGEPVAWWNGTGNEAILSQRGAGVQIRWREVVREPMARLPSPPPVPASYTSSCAGRG